MVEVLKRSYIINVILYWVGLEYEEKVFLYCIKIIYGIYIRVINSYS